MACHVSELLTDFITGRMLFDMMCVCVCVCSIQQHIQRRGHLLSHKVLSSVVFVLYVTDESLLSV